MVEMAISPRRPRRSRQRAASSARRPARFFQPLDDPLPHLGGGLAREGDRQDVLGLDAGSQQVDVALHEHARLAGAGGGFEHDVSGRIDRETPGVGISRQSPGVGRRSASRNLGVVIGQSLAVNSGDCQAADGSTVGCRLSAC